MAGRANSTSAATLDATIGGRVCKRSSRQARGQKSPGKHECPNCPSRYTRTSNLNIHLKKEHPLEGDSTSVAHECSASGCGKIYTRRDSLKRHQKIKGHESRSASEESRSPEILPEISPEVLSSFKNQLPQFRAVQTDHGNQIYGGTDTDDQGITTVLTATASRQRAIVPGTSDTSSSDNQQDFQRDRPGYRALQSTTNLSNASQYVPQSQSTATMVKDNDCQSSQNGNLATSLPSTDSSLYQHTFWMILEFSIPNNGNISLKVGKIISSEDLDDLLKQRHHQRPDLTASYQPEVTSSNITPVTQFPVSQSEDRALGDPGRLVDRTPSQAAMPQPRHREIPSIYQQRRLASPSASTQPHVVINGAQSRTYNSRHQSQICQQDEVLVDNNGWQSPATSSFLISDAMTVDDSSNTNNMSLFSMGGCLWSGLPGG